ncbi:hypothetical protein [Pseudoalteromonas mariniglutinosa]|uniref:maleate cis-trans isomerase family protein n=1 Tax=Pseudoalteromonas mariniglutinosa TaxID=206042 RepID=UPI00385125A2
MSNISSFWSHKVGVLTPATNVTVENELWNMKIDPVTIATSRIKIDTLDWTAPDGIQKFVEAVASRLPETAKRLQCKPDSLLLAISSSSLWGGLEGNEKLKNHISSITGLDMVTPADAVVAAVNKLKLKRVGVITPFPSLADKRIVNFFKEFNVEVVSQKGMRADNPTEIGHFSERVLLDAVKEVNSDKVDAVIQLGTELTMARVAPIAEGWLNKPVFSVNATTWWHFLRKNKFEHQLSGWGTLLQNY